MSKEELQIVNAFIGFCKPSGDTWPGPFVEDQYNVTGLELPVTVSVSGEVRNPTPELILSSGEVQHSILLEAKSKGVNLRQARSYEQIGSRELVVSGAADVNIDVESSQVDVIYVAPLCKSAALVEDAQRVSVAFPILSMSDSSFELIYGSGKRDCVKEVFQGGLRVDTRAWPSHYVRCDCTSSSGLIAAMIMNKAISHLRRDGEVRLEPLCADSIDFWDRRGADNQKAFRNRIAEILSEASHNELFEFIAKSKTGRVWTLKKSGTMQPVTLDRLSDAVLRFVERKQQEEVEQQSPLIAFEQQ